MQFLQNIDLYSHSLAILQARLCSLHTKRLEIELSIAKQDMHISLEEDTYALQLLKTEKTCLETFLQFVEAEIKDLENVEIVPNMEEIFSNE